MGKYISPRLKTDTTYAEFLHAAKPGTLAPIDQRALNQDAEWVVKNPDRAAALDTLIGRKAVLIEWVGIFQPGYTVTIADRWLGHLIVYNLRIALSVHPRQLDFDVVKKEAKIDSSTGDQGGALQRSRVQIDQAR